MTDVVPRRISRTSSSIERIKHLAAHWKVSQAEAVRRAVELTEQDILHTRENTLLRLRDYHYKGGIARDKAEAYLDEVCKARGNWA